MKIGEVIRKYRKEKQLTQEEMAGYLGVTTPAVNKWENGNSMPDISLLAPIARLLGISTDTLLSYQNELTDKEISRKIELLSEKMKMDSYENVFHWTEEQIREYPNCDKLILVAAQTLDGYRTILNLEDASNMMKEFISCICVWRTVRSMHLPCQHGFPFFII